MTNLTDPLVLAIDQGTTGTTVVLMTPHGQGLARATCEFPQSFPQPGWVEHDPELIWQSVLAAMSAVLAEVTGASDRVRAIGIANQRETMVVWDAKTGRAVHPALVWQDRRTAARCLELAEHNERVTKVTGLVIDPYFSASKLQWLLEEDPAMLGLARNKSIRFGTVDSFLVDRLSSASRGLSQRHVIEVTNASRTLLMDLGSQSWSLEMCKLWGIPPEMLPDIVPSAGTIARTVGVPGLPDGIPVSGIAGDQHAALFGQGCVHAGDVKCTYGTGAFVLANTGKVPIASRSGLLTTVAWQVGDEVVYALEGSAFNAGAAVQWLRDGLGIIENSADVEALARSVSTSEGVTFVPALSGLGAPYWDPEARGLLCGITRGTGAGHIARATLEGIAFQVDDLLRALRADLQLADSTVSLLRVDGGAAKNDLLLQLQADLSDLRIDRPMDTESTARGAGLLAAIGSGLLSGVEEAAQAVQLERSFFREAEGAQVENDRRRWEQAVGRARSACGQHEPT